ncbi:hypothetical protein JT31_02555 [Cedecea neteri]|uniref:Uncharacterized protein n=1 Tax=Cedecea neteri TaxID=158822 RepID=A0A089RAD6_9ENTR|nr:hypothetical protein [Cedecea neteri]AIR03535.1 hypothetical protein JT31_02555 [Cedecea neteri]
MKTSGGGPNVWPGYVAAVAGLGISLLLLIAVLGLGIFQIGASIHEKIVQGFKPNIDGDIKLTSPVGGAVQNDKKELAASEGEKTTAVADIGNSDAALNLKSSEAVRVLSIVQESSNGLQKKGSNPLLDMPGNEGSINNHVVIENDRKVLSERKSEDDSDITYQFSDGIYKLSEAAKKMSTTIVEQHLVGYRVTISASASVDVETASRIAYIRILAVRNYFLDSGYEREKVIVKLIPVSPDVSNQNAVKIKFIRDDKPTIE